MISKHQESRYFLLSEIVFVSCVRYERDPYIPSILPPKKNDALSTGLSPLRDSTRGVERKIDDCGLTPLQLETRFEDKITWI